MAPTGNGCREDDCGAPENLVDPATGYCPSHSPGASQRLSEAGRKGGKTTAKRMAAEGLEEGELPPLENAEAAETWCDVLGRAVVTGRLTHHQGKAALRAVREWRESHESGEVSERLDRLMDALSEWRETGSPDPVLELIE